MTSRKERKLIQIISIHEVEKKRITTGATESALTLRLTIPLKHEKVSELP